MVTQNMVIIQNVRCQNIFKCATVLTTNNCSLYSFHLIDSQNLDFAPVFYPFVGSFCYKLCSAIKNILMAINGSSTVDVQ